MTDAIQRRKGTTAEHATFTGLLAEITVDTTKLTLVTHDGSTAGGFPVAREDLSNVRSYLGASSSISGLKGLVPAAAAGDENKMLRGDATWAAVDYSEINNTPSLATIATSGSYNDLTSKPSFATVATSGSYNDLTSKPTIPDAQVQVDWNSNAGVTKILNRPSIPAAQIQTDWNANSGMGVLLNKPTLATVATSGSYDDLSNKPTIPSTTGFVKTYIRSTSPTADNGAPTYNTGDMWLDTVNTALWICFDNSAGFAVWYQITITVV